MRISAASHLTVGPSGDQECFINGGYACLNAWNGGPWVNVYTGGPNTPNNDFTVISSQSNGIYVEIEDTGANTWSGQCIGDAYNESGQADTSLDPCGFSGPAGWGTNFTYTYGPPNCPSGEIAFKNNHWGGWLGPPNNWVNGSHFYLNNPAIYCFHSYNAVG
jgi:hypothetical protein